MAFELGFISGYEDGQFRPDNPVTRAEYTKIVLEAFEIRFGKTDTVFSDTVGHWAELYINEAAAKHLIVGVGEDRFEPDLPLARQDAATILLRVLTYLNVELVDSGAGIEFLDASDISGYARAAVSRMSKAGIISGDENGCFSPFDYLTRAEAVKLIVATLDFIDSTAIIEVISD
jgi:hypothetical protein